MRPTGPLLLMTGLQGVAGGIFVTLALLGTAFGPQVLSRTAWEVLSGSGLALVLGGGVSSVFHMHRLAGARFVLRRLRSSWLSREVLTTSLLGFSAAVVVLAPVVVPVTSGWYVDGAIVTALLALLALFVTAMIYATIPAMLSWHTPLTVVNMMGTGLLSGAVWVKAGWDVTGPHRPTATHALDAALVAALILWGVLKVLQLRVFREARARLRAETGFGLPRGPYRLLDTGTTRPPFRTQTQVWPPIGRALRVRWERALWAAFLAVLLMAGMERPAGALALVAALVMVYIERWLFFADATHSSLVWFPTARDDRRRSSIPVNP